MAKSEEQSNEVLRKLIEKLFTSLGKYHSSMHFTTSAQYMRNEDFYGNDYNSFTKEKLRFFH